jgi:signal peptidase I
MEGIMLNNTLENEDSIKKRLLTVIIIILTVVIIRVFYFPCIVHGQSMYPTLINGNILMINSFIYTHDQKFKKGDIVVVDVNMEGERDKRIVKRIIGTENDELSIHDGFVYLNKKRVKEPYIHVPTEVDAHGVDSWRIGKDAVFLLGDNRVNSLDSREIGEVKTNSILGKAEYSLLFPCKIHN